MFPVPVNGSFAPIFSEFIVSGQHHYRALGADLRPAAYGTGLWLWSSRSPACQHPGEHSFSPLLLSCLWIPAARSPALRFQGLRWTEVESAGVLSCTGPGGGDLGRSPLRGQRPFPPGGSAWAFSLRPKVSAWAFSPLDAGSPYRGRFTVLSGAPLIPPGVSFFNDARTLRLVPGFSRNLWTEAVCFVLLLTGAAALTDFPM